jgi:hypothetical protein
MWVDRDGDEVLFSTVAGRRKHRNFERDARASVTMIDSEDPYQLRRVARQDQDIDWAVGAQALRAARRRWRALSS